MAVSNALTNSGEPAIVIDEAHLGRMTLGDRSLEREILEIFVRQVDIMLDRIATAEPPLVAAAAHTLVGSARGIGAPRVALAAEQLEAAVTRDAGIDRAICQLRSATAEASAAICARLRACLPQDPRQPPGQPPR